MRIAVITNFDKKNYGSVLQAFALQTAIAELGADGFVLQKRNIKKLGMLARLKRTFTPSANNYSVKDKLEIKRAKRRYEKKYNKIASFCSDHIKVRCCSSLEGATALVGDADALLAGSDQIWSPRAGLLSEFTTLQFGSDRLKRYSYAASLGVQELDSSEESILKKGLSKFECVSLRESSSEPIIKRLFNRDVVTSLDPTLLYDSSFWEQFVSDTTTQEYILVYMLRPEPMTLLCAKKLSARLGLPIFLLSNRIINDKSINNITDAGIEEFLSYFQNAKYVVTNSFHGTAFSVQFQKQFLSIPVEGSGMRVSDFLKMLGLEDRIVASEDDIQSIDLSIDWESVTSILENKRMEAFNYLKMVCSPSVSVDKELVLYHDKTECCGCGACANICPKNAISLKKDEHGFLYPEIDERVCIKCKLCKTICNYQNTHDNQTTVKETWSVISKDKQIRHHAASGGAFGAIAQQIIKKNGIVYGCAFCNEGGSLIPKHIGIEKIEDLIKLQSSKYAQSEIGYTYKDIKGELENGRLVLFCGTGCQVAGLTGFLKGKQYENLYMIDLICHGVPSADLLIGYQHMMEKKLNAKIIDINFRDKTYGWGVKGTLSYQKKDALYKKSIDSNSSSYYNLYLKAGFYRQNCYSCRYANLSRSGDITIGDFWGIGDSHSQYLSTNGGDWKKEEGVSCLLVNTEQGKKLLHLFADDLDIKPCSIDDITLKNKMLLRPSAYNECRKTVLELFEKQGYDAVDKWFWKKYGKTLFRTRLWLSLPIAIRNKLKGKK